jgi:hypothetical protein
LYGIAPDGRNVALLDLDGVFGVWEIDPWRPVARWEGAEWHEVGLTFDPPGTRVFVACYDTGLVVGAVDTDRLIRLPQQHKGEYTHLSHFDISRRGAEGPDRKRPGSRPQRDIRTILE